VQKAGVAALNGPQDHIKGVVEKLRQRRDYSYKRLNEMEGMSTTNPRVHSTSSQNRRSRHAMENDMDFVVDLLKATGVLIVNGSGSTQSTEQGIQE